MTYIQTKFSQLLKYFIIFISRNLSTKYLGALFNYNLIINCCQFLMAFVNRTRLLIDIVMFNVR